MRFALHDLQSKQFEDLVVEVCHELLGPGVQAFSTGPDGGRDAKFVGTAEQFPSAADPLVGTTIIQAKHTIDAIGKFSDKGFSGDAKTSTLSEEMPRIKRLRDNGKLDNYLLFANRRLGSVANETIVDRITSQTGVKVVHLFGVEALERYIKRYPFLATTISDFEYDLPLRASPDDLADVITAIAKVQPNIEWPEASSATSLERIAFKKKNELNGLSEDYAELITRQYLKHFRPVQEFLADPINVEAYASYRNAVDEFEAKLLAHKSDFGTYDKLLDYLLSTLIHRDADLSSNKRLTRTVFYFMYWTCDIGETEDEKTDATSN